VMIRGRRRQITHREMRSLVEGEEIAESFRGSKERFQALSVERRRSSGEATRRRQRRGRTAELRRGLQCNHVAWKGVDGGQGGGAGGRCQRFLAGVLWMFGGCKQLGAVARVTREGEGGNWRKRVYVTLVPVAAMRSSSLHSDGGGDF
jgi:hypothetical protein